MAQQEWISPNDAPPGDAASAAAALRDKLTDILTPGYQAEFDPDEAEEAGAFAEGALSLEDAADSAYGKAPLWEAVPCARFNECRQACTAVCRRPIPCNASYSRRLLSR